MKTLIGGREKSLLKASADGNQAATSKAQFFEQSDVITLQLKLIPQNGRSGMAAVDVYEQEPVLGAAHPLLAMDNAPRTPHIGFVERDFFEEIFNGMFDQVNAFAEGKPVNIVNPDARQSSMLP